jgi:hypothetical protein
MMRLPAGYETIVIAGLDPAILHLRKKSLRRSMDARVKPAHDAIYILRLSQRPDPRSIARRERGRTLVVMGEQIPIGGDFINVVIPRHFARHTLPHHRLCYRSG